MLVYSFAYILIKKIVFIIIIIIIITIIVIIIIIITFKISSPLLMLADDVLGYADACNDLLNDARYLCKTRSL